MYWRVLKKQKRSQTIWFLLLKWKHWSLISMVKSTSPATGWARMDICRYLTTIQQQNNNNNNWVWLLGLCEHPDHPLHRCLIQFFLSLSLFLLLLLLARWPINWLTSRWQAKQRAPMSLAWLNSSCTEELRHYDQVKIIIIIRKTINLYNQLNYIIICSITSILIIIFFFFCFSFKTNVS